MRLNAKPLKNIVDVNHFDYANELYIGASDGKSEAGTLYVQLIDLDQNNLRYMPSNGTTLSVLFPALEEEDEITIVMTQPFLQDTSIWAVSIPDGSFIRSGNMIFTMVENGVTKKFVLKNGLVVDHVGQGGC